MSIRGGGRARSVIGSAREGVEPLPGALRSIGVGAARSDHPGSPRRRADYKRWERSRSMELWQMDIVGGVMSRGWLEGKRS